jgi:hypothetical protein
MVMQEFFSRAEAGEDMHVITATFEWCLDNLFLTRCSAEEVRAYDILEHLSKHRALCSHFADFRAIVKRQSDPEFNDGVRRKTLTLHPTYLHKVFIYDGSAFLPSPPISP